MKTRLVATEAFRQWYYSLPKSVFRFVYRDLRTLRDMGRELPPVKAKRLKSVADLWELRVKAGGNQVRVFFAYDRESDAVLLLGGFKNDRRLYGSILRHAQDEWRNYVSEKKNPQQARFEIGWEDFEEGT